jgi:catechol 2,3-dioxygenase
MQIQSLGHAVLKVRNLDRAVAFYNGVLGLPIATRNDEYKMIFFSLGNHHDFAIAAVSDDAPLADSKGVGLDHVAFKVGNTLEELRATKEFLLGENVKIDAIFDHTVTNSIYINDPDGNGIELYVDVSDAWKKEPALVASGEPMEL